ncbi:MAG: primosomal protein N' [Phycisphaerales bacterium]|jgi:primosomal protein N' (replication factor Y)|nr:primosomal protein N' [Phycisphaerales bacterium]
MQSLFGEMEDKRAPVHAGPFASVALENSLDKTLDYAIPAPLLTQLRVGQRVRVPLGRSNRSTFGFVTSIHPTTTYPRIKPLLNIDDPRVLVDEKLMQLARWISRYYCAPLGTVLDNVIPSAVKKKVGLGYSQMVHLLRDRAQVQELIENMRAPKRRAILARLLLLPADQSIELHRLASEANAKPAGVRQLAKLGWISITPKADLDQLQSPFVYDLEDGGGKEISDPPQLNPDQQRAIDDLSPRLQQPQFSVNLLYGVTGSGKTEVYLRCIQQIVEQGRQAIVLVPEIALTPQTVRRFIARFPRVAILHSGLSATDRHRYWQQISAGKAQVIVGARSAIFAPVPNLGIIVVDEEHESSYKQDTAPRYHARDVAVKRAQIESVPVILGSATPSLETFSRFSSHSAGRASEHYHLLKLPNRVRDLPMPAVELVNMMNESRLRRGIHLISQRLEHLLRTTLEAGHQAILLLNRRGYSNFVYCASCQEALQCKYCDTTMTYHRMAGSDAKGGSVAQGIHTGQLHCHYCLAVTPLPSVCPKCHKKMTLFGMGTQRVDEELSHKFPGLNYARVDSDTMRSARDYESLLGRFARGDIRVLLGTQMIAKGLDYPNVTLVGVISGDTALALPDFRAAERTFQLITQVAGRAGRGDLAGRVVLQTFMPDDPTIKAALRQDYDGFAKSELAHRHEVELPPFTRMARIILRDQELEHLHQKTEQMAAVLADAVATLDQPDQVRIKGPMPCAIARIAGYYRFQLVLISPKATYLQALLAKVRDKGEFTRAERVAVDVDPISLL